MKLVSDKFYDKSLKLHRYKNFDSLCYTCGIFIEFDHFNNTELVDDGGTTYIMDISLTDKRGFVVLIELQSSYVTEDDINRFMKYAMLSYQFEAKAVHIYVISTVEKEDRIIRRKWNFFNEFTIYVKSLKSMNGDKRLNSLREKIKNNEELSDDDVTDLETIIFMDSNRSTVQLLRELICLLNEIENMDEELMYDVKTFFLMYVRKFVEDESEARRLVEMIELRRDLYGRAIESIRNESFLEGEAKGEAKGEVKTERRLVKNLLNYGLDLNTISKMLQLDIDYLEEIASAL